MGVIDVTIRTITCNGLGCDKTLTFDRGKEQQTFETPGNEWLKSARVVQSADGRNMLYCSDACEVKAVATGVHNMPQPKKIIEPGANPSAIAAAAAAAKQAEQATAALKAGGPVKLE